MKRTVTLLLALLLALAALPACADAALDAAFESGALRLVETTQGGLDLAACKLALTETFLKYNKAEPIDDKQLQQAYQQQFLSEITVLSVSPAGTSAILNAEGTLMALNGQTVTPFCPNEARSAEEISDSCNSYARMDKYFQRGARLIAEDGVVWSHDGRYAVLPNWKMAFVNAQYMDPMIFDTLTGDIFLAASYERKATKANNGTMANACFSADDRYLYYGFWGNVGEYKCSIMRCDLTTGENEQIWNGDVWNNYPSLYETSSGFMAIADVNNTQQPQGVWLAAQADGAWTDGTHPFNLPCGLARTTRLSYSANSGYATALFANRMSAAPFALKCFRPEDDFAGLDAWWLMKADTLALTAEPLTEETLADYFAVNESGQITALKDDYLYLPGAWFSPDGRYALVEYGRGSDMALRLVRLEDMTSVPVEGVEGKLQPAYTDLAMEYAPFCEWNGDTIILLVDGEAKTYAIAEN